jgi:hypothetical protein
MNWNPPKGGGKGEPPVPPTINHIVEHLAHLADL